MSSQCWSVCHAGCSDLDVTQRDKHMGRCTEFKQAIWQRADNTAALRGRSAALSCTYFSVIWPACQHGRFWVSPARRWGGQRHCAVPPCLCMCRSRSGPGSEGSERRTRWTGSWTWAGTRRSPSSTPGSDISCSSSASCFGWVELEVSLEIFIFKINVAGRHLKRCSAFLGFLSSPKSKEANTRTCSF